MRLFLFTPMVAEYALLMQKMATGSQMKSSLTDFGFAVRRIQWPDAETEEIAVRVWPGEDGEDAYIPPAGQKLQAYDLEVEFIYKGELNTVYAKCKALRKYLTGAGGFLILYDPYWKVGCTKVYVKKFGDLKPVRTNIDEFMSAKLTFRVTDPAAEVTTGVNQNGEIINLEVRYDVDD